MRAFQTQGLSAAEAARLALESTAAAETSAGTARWHLDPDPLARPSSASTSRPRRRLSTARSPPSASTSLLRDLLIPYLHDLGERWEAGTASVAQEHFASNFLRGRLLGLARGWGQGGGPLAILACAPSELHDLPLIAFGLALRAHGWRIAFLGPDTPLGTLPTRPRSSSRGSSSSAPRPPRGSRASATSSGRSRARRPSRSPAPERRTRWPSRLAPPCSLAGPGGGRPGGVPNRTPKPSHLHVCRDCGLMARSEFGSAGLQSSGTTRRASTP